MTKFNYFIITVLLLVGFVLTSFGFVAFVTAKQVDLEYQKALTQLKTINAEEEARLGRLFLSAMRVLKDNPPCKLQKTQADLEFCKSERLAKVYNGLQKQGLSKPDIKLILNEFDLI